MAVRVFVDGQEGTTGLKLNERLMGREDVEIIRIDPALRKDPDARRECMKRADYVFLCLPEQAAAEAAALAGDARVLDASTAHRTNPDWVYGLPELSQAQRDAVKNARRVAVPGCHATGFVSLIAPLTANGLLRADAPLSCHSLTGYSGGGKSMIAQYKDPARAESFKSARMYALTLSHKHLPEMQALCALAAPPLFDPIVGDFEQGMLVSVPLHGAFFSRPAGARDVHEALAAHYEGQRFIRVMPFGWLPGDGFLNATDLNGTNQMEICVFGRGDHTLLCARFDNLGKGASGAAVQCFNLMSGADEACSL